MARYVFKVFDGGEIDGEPVAIELPDLAAARLEAIRTAAEMLRDIAGDFFGDEWCMEVTDDADQPLLRLRFRTEELA